MNDNIMKTSSLAAMPLTFDINNTKNPSGWMSARLQFLQTLDKDQLLKLVTQHELNIILTTK